MLFNSLGYLLFLLAGVGIHWLLPHRLRVYFICLASVTFYAMWRWEFSLLVVFSAVVDYVSAARIHAGARRGVRRAWLVTSLTVNLGLLVFFKYTYFIAENVSALASRLGLGAIDPSGWGLKIILPLGISFYTFQTISYTIDVYRGVTRPTRHFPTFLAYVMFWPQLIAGPILRAGEVIPLLAGTRRFGLDDLQAGFWRVLCGLFKKAVVADGLARMVEYWFDQPIGALTAVDVWVAAVLFAFQIYCDFSGYSDIAIGSARMLGIRFPDNFNWPYLAVSPRDFWRRWHISLSSWIRDYLYLPLTGRPFQTHSTGGIAVAAEAGPRGLRRRDLALLGTWLIMGLWHGAAWKFVLWGGYHGLIVLLFRAIGPLDRLTQRVPVLGWALTTLIVMAGWIPFRAHSVAQATRMFAKLLSPGQYRLSEAVTGLSVRIAGYSYLWAFLLPLLTVILFGLWRTLRGRNLPAAVELPARVAIAGAMTVLILLSMGAKEVFIYFQF